MAGETVLTGLLKVGAGGAWLEVGSGMNLSDATTDVEARITRPGSSEPIVKSRALDTIKIIGTDDTDYEPSDPAVDCLVWIAIGDFTVSGPGPYLIEFHDLTGDRELISNQGHFRVWPTAWPT
jgi:hypothetical protein